jgi:hypothetical protein
MSSMRSLRKITLPADSAMLTPTWNFDGSVWRILISPWPASMSSVSILMPRTRLAPLSFMVSRMSSGLVGRKFEGDRALDNCRR